MHMVIIVESMIIMSIMSIMIIMSIMSIMSIYVGDKILHKN